MTRKKAEFKVAAKESDIFNRRLLKLRRENSAASFGSHDFLNLEITNRLLDNLGDIKRDFNIILNMNAHDAALKAHFKEDPLIIKQDLAHAMVKTSPFLALQGDEEYLPFRNKSVDLVLSSLNLHWVNDLPGALIQILHSLKPDGLFLSALFGGETLYELRQSMLKADMDVLGGSIPHISPTMDIKDAGGLMQRAGFALPVVSTERITVTYRDPFALMKELKGMGENNVLSKGYKGLSSKKSMMKMAEFYHADFANSVGRIPATFDILYFQGWAPHESQQQPLKPGSASMALKDVLGKDPLKS